MAWDPVRNFAKVVVSGVYGATDTTIYLASGEGTKLPDPSIDGQFNLVWWNATDYQDPADDSYREIVRVTAKTGDTLTVLRGQENTSATPKNLAGKIYKMMMVLSKKTYDELHTIEVYKGGALVGQRGKIDFYNFNVVDDATNQKVKIYPIQGSSFGDGSDGDLIISAGTYTIDLQNKQIFLKNYNSISITGTGAVNFINPHTNGTIVIFRVKGDCTITSTTNPAIDLGGIGQSGGQATNPTFLDLGLPPGALNGKGGGYGGIGPSGQGQGGAGGVWNQDTNAKITSSFLVYTQSSPLPFSHFLSKVSCGGGGGNGGDSGTASGGAGGRGGGALILMVGGSLNFTGTISASGQNGQNGASVSGSGAGGGGGGGAGGCVLIVYNNLIANTGTILVNGGNGGNGASSTGGSHGGGGGGGGGQIYASGGSGSLAGGNGNNGGNGYTGGIGGAGGSAGAPFSVYSGGGGGGGGAAGEKLILQNVWF